MVSFGLVTVLAFGLTVLAGVLRAGDRDRPRISPPSAAVPDPGPEPVAPRRRAQGPGVEPDEHPGSLRVGHRAVERAEAEAVRQSGVAEPFQPEVRRRTRRAG